MKLEDLKVEKNGSITIGSIFEFDSSLDITLLVDKCRRAGCTVRFENEDITIDDTYNDDAGTRAKVMLYTLLANHPEAAMDYFRYCMSVASKK